MDKHLSRILILADLEGSSACWSYAAASFLTDEWARACLGMSQDVSSVVSALFDAGVETVTIKDFHRTGYNLFAELFDARARIISGYRHGPVPGIGNPESTQAVMFLGMHAASGSDGFLAHTLTSRIARLTLNNRYLAEVELFAASLAPWGIRPIFFSGCPVACEQATAVIENMDCFPIDKSPGPESFDASAWRIGLAQAAVNALSNQKTKPYRPTGPFEVRATLREGKAEAVRLARRWNFEQIGEQIQLQADQMEQLYRALIKLCYLTPLTIKILPLALAASNLRGRLGIMWARRRLNHLAVSIE
ncbi:MAG: M55 family metallopeptidase [Desulfobacterales bacterium]|jgi:D-aminopeptidase